MVLASPLFRLPQQPIPNLFARPLAQTLSLLGFAKIGTGTGSHDKKQFAKNKLTHDFHTFQMICESPYRFPSATFGWVSQTFRACDEIFRPQNLKKLSAPTLVLSPEQEKVVDARGHHDWVQAARKLANVEVSLKLISEARHELFSETLTIRNQR